MRAAVLSLVPDLPVWYCAPNQARFRIRVHVRRNTASGPLLRRPTVFEYLLFSFIRAINQPPTSIPVNCSPLDADSNCPRGRNGKTTRNSQKPNEYLEHSRVEFFVPIGAVFRYILFDRCWFLTVCLSSYDKRERRRFRLPPLCLIITMHVKFASCTTTMAKMFQNCRKTTRIFKNNCKACETKVAHRDLYNKPYFVLGTQWNVRRKKRKNVFYRSLVCRIFFIPSHPCDETLRDQNNSLFLEILFDLKNSLGQYIFVFETL